SAWAIARREQGRSEARRLQRLIDRIYRSRALKLVPTGPVQTDPLDEEQQGDFQRATASILVTRSLIEDSINFFDSKKDSITVLDEMYVATLNYLNVTERDPRTYNTELMRLRKELVTGEQRLKQLNPHLILREPGGADQREPR